MKFKRKLLAAAAVLALAAGAAHAQISGNVVKIGVLNDQSSLYADLSGPGLRRSPRRWRSRTSRRSEKGLNVEVIFADHQNKPDVGSQIARKWYDSEGVDVIVDTPNSGVALAVNQITQGQGQGLPRSPARRPRTSPARPARPTPIHWTYDTWMLANGTGNAIVKTGGDTWFFLTADYAFGHALERDTEAVGAEDRRQGARQGARTRSTRRTSRRSCCRRRPRRPRSSGSPTPAATRSTRSSRRPSSAS